MLNYGHGTLKYFRHKILNMSDMEWENSEMFVDNFPASEIQNCCYVVNEKLNTSREWNNITSMFSSQLMGFFQKQTVIISLQNAINETLN